jgi:phage tail-like protein
MPNPKDEQVTYPFTAFNFAVEINVEGVAERVCDASFAECDGLEMSMDVKTIREGGNNGKQIRLTGPLTFGQVTMKRGMTANLELWDWFNLMLTDQSLRANAEVVIFAAVAIEEFQRAYEKLTLKKPTR